ncbi:hypothetical protein [Nocardioides sp. L-11A]|uniref:hypothetical protein n=1 Tax=Nocardioides sp. L-11A TaxID=3043848 RepID=UPI00249BF617|nr:hypothetical protein QJ852_22140 [Nocardioides sp. L-11A]
MTGIVEPTSPRASGRRQRVPHLDAYGSATRALRRAHQQATQGTERITRQIAAGVVPDGEELARYRRLSAALRYAEAVWLVEADLLVAAAGLEATAARRSGAGA